MPPAALKARNFRYGMRAGPARAGMPARENATPTAQEDRGPAATGQEVLGVVEPRAALAQDVHRSTRGPILPAPLATPPRVAAGRVVSANRLRPRRGAP